MRKLAIQTSDEDEDDDCVSIAIVEQTHYYEDFGDTSLPEEYDGNVNLNRTNCFKASNGILLASECIPEWYDSLSIFFVRGKHKRGHRYKIYVDLETSCLLEEAVREYNQRFGYTKSPEDVLLECWQ
jgi:hypothetical protein